VITKIFWIPGTTWLPIAHPCWKGAESDEITPCHALEYRIGTGKPLRDHRHHSVTISGKTRPYRYIRYIREALPHFYLTKRNRPDKTKFLHLPFAASTDMLRVAGTEASPPSTLGVPSTFLRLSAFAVVLLLAFFGLSSHWSKQLEAHPVDTRSEMPKSRREETTGADACLRWSHQSALVKDTIYIYGGQARAGRDQHSNTWSMVCCSHFVPLVWLSVRLDNNFLALSLSDDWDVGSPPLEVLPQPKGPPAVANGWVATGVGMGERWAADVSVGIYGITEITFTFTGGSSQTPLPRRRRRSRYGPITLRPGNGQTLHPRHPCRVTPEVRRSSGLRKAQE
jgi:hypothetical protein